MTGSISVWKVESSISGVLESNFYICKTHYFYTGAKKKGVEPNTVLISYSWCGLLYFFFEVFAICFSHVEVLQFWPLSISYFIVASYFKAQIPQSNKISLLHYKSELRMIEDNPGIVWKCFLVVSWTALQVGSISPEEESYNNITFLQS